MHTATRLDDFKQSTTFNRSFTVKTNTLFKNHFFSRYTFVSNLKSNKSFLNAVREMLPKQFTHKF